MSQDSNLAVKSLAWIVKNRINRGHNIKIINPMGSNITKKSNFFMQIITDLPALLIDNGLSLFKDNALQYLGNIFFEYFTQKMIAEPVAEEDDTESVAEEDDTESVAEEEVAEPATAEDEEDDVAGGSTSDDHASNEDSITESDQEVINRLRNILAMHNIAE